MASVSPSYHKKGQQQKGHQGKERNKKMFGLCSFSSQWKNKRNLKFLINTENYSIETQHQLF